MSAVMAQPINVERSKEGKKPSLLGKINKEGLSTAPYSEWFNKNYESYKTKKEAIDSLQKHLSKYTITAFMGTWCGDSKREVPKFYKVLEEAEFPLERLTMVAVSRNRATYKQSPGGEHEAQTIHRVPTFIIYKNGKEQNRIVESPVSSIEEDLVAIIQKEYTSNYYGVTLVSELLHDLDDRKFQKKQKRLIPELKKHLKNMYELNTYSSVLFYGNLYDEAIAVARLNTLLFPNEAKTFGNLANKLLEMNENEGALENFKKAYELDPSKEEVKKQIDQLMSSRKTASLNKTAP